MKQLLKLEDINLSLLEFSLNGNTVSVELLNMHDGEVVAELYFNGIIKMNYQGMDDSEILPAYIGEIEVLHEKGNTEDALFHLKMCGWLDLTLTSKDAVIKLVS